MIGLAIHVKLTHIFQVVLICEGRRSHPRVDIRCALQLDDGNVVDPLLRWPLVRLVPRVHDEADRLDALCSVFLGHVGLEIVPPQLDADLKGRGEGGWAVLR